MTEKNEKDYLPNVPIITVTADETTDSGPGFLTVARTKGKFTYPDDSVSEQVTIDHVVRKSDDVVAIVAFGKTDPDATKNEPYIFLRSAIRPAIALRDFISTGVPEAKNVGNLWEVPAGLVDPGESGVDGLLNAAARELEEEIGFKVPAWKFFFLGKRTFPAVGISGERIFFLAVEISEFIRNEPTLDGSPFELHGEVVPIKLSVAETAVHDGYIMDSKTEIAISRLARYLKDG